MDLDNAEILHSLVLCPPTLALLPIAFLIKSGILTTVICLFEYFTKLPSIKPK
jgi:hypothetical protein